MGVVKFNGGVRLMLYPVSINGCTARLVAVGTQAMYLKRQRMKNDSLRERIAKLLEVYSVEDLLEMSDVETVEFLYDVIEAGYLIIPDVEEPL